MNSKTFIATLLAVSSTAIASPHAMPEAFALAMASPQGPSYQCHSDCGNAILQARNCGEDTSCYCGENTPFRSSMANCYVCGSSLWKDYGNYLVPYLEKCNMKTTPNPPTSSAAAAASSIAVPAPATSQTSTFSSAASTSSAHSESGHTSSKAASTSTSTAHTSSGHATTSAAPTSSTHANTSPAKTSAASHSGNTTITQVNSATSWELSFGVAAIVGIAALI